MDFFLVILGTLYSSGKLVREMLKMVFYDNFFLSASSKQKEMVVSPKLMDDSKLFILDIKRELHNNSGRKMI